MFVWNEENGKKIR